MSRGFWNLEDVSNERLVERLKGLLSAEGRTEARVVAHLAELDERRLHLMGGQSSFEYCQKELRLSEGQAFYRITAARTARRFPVVFEMLERREIHITAITLISKYLTEENHVELLREARGLTKRQLLELLVQRFPKAGVENGVRRLPPRSGAVTAGPTGLLEPLRSERYCLQLDIDRETLEALELARDLMSHSNPTGDLCRVVKRALKGLVEQLMKERFGQTSGAQRKGRNQPGRAEVHPLTGGREHFGQHKSDTAASQEGRPRNMASWSGSHAAREKQVRNEQGPEEQVRKGQGPEDQRLSRRRGKIGNATRRELVERDGLCCSFVSENGMRCTARAFLQVDHEQAWAKGGSDEIGNLRVLCRAHNLLLAEREFGRRPIKKTG